MNPAVPQVNFSKGEIGPQLYARFDVEAWNSALKKARNVIVQKYGGVIKRQGTRLVSEVLDGAEPTRLIPFEFSLEQTYALEFGQGFAAPIARGGRVLEIELEILAATTGATTTLTANFHDYVAGDPVFITGVIGELGQRLNNQFWRVLSVVNTNSFVIDANTTGLTFEGSTGGTTRVGPNPPRIDGPFIPLPPQPPAPPNTTPPDGDWVLQQGLEF
jgi:hypothetical protein